MNAWFYILVSINAFGFFMLYRNLWTLKKRFETILKDFDAYQKLPSYDRMMWSFWVWDVKKFLPLLAVLLCSFLSSCAYTNSKGSIMLGGKGAAKGGGEGDGSWAMVWNGEKSFRDGAVLVGTVATGYFGMAAQKASETTSQVVAKEATKKHAATQGTIQNGQNVHAAAYGTAVGAEVPGVVAPAPPVAPIAPAP